MAKSTPSTKATNLAKHSNSAPEQLVFILMDDNHRRNYAMMLLPCRQNPSPLHSIVTFVAAGVAWISVDK
jgi:hypothetical protein